MTFRFVYPFKELGLDKTILDTDLGEEVHDISYNGGIGGPDWSYFHQILHVGSVIITSKLTVDFVKDFFISYAVDEVRKKVHQTYVSLRKMIKKKDNISAETPTTDLMPTLVFSYKTKTKKEIILTIPISALEDVEKRIYAIQSMNLPDKQIDAIIAQLKGPLIGITLGWDIKHTKYVIVDIQDITAHDSKETPY